MNRIHDYITSAGPMPIEKGFAQKLLSRYLAELDLGKDSLEAIRDRREASAPKLIFQEGKELKSVDFDGPNIEARAGQIAHFKLSGGMFQDDFLSTRGMQSMAADLRRAYASPNISGVLIEADTGGGELLAGQTLRNAIKDRNKPVLVYAHYLASAGVWGTLFADHIMAAGEGSEIGSIGVYTSFNKEFLTAYKERIQDVYATTSPDKNKDFRALLDGDISPLQESVDQADQIFMRDVRENRPLKGDVEKTLAGGMFYAREARRRGLVDSIGTFNDAISQLNRLIRAENRQTMSKNIFQQFAEKFLGKKFETEEEAQAALEAAEAPTQLSDLEARLGEVATKVAETATLAEQVAALSTQVQTVTEQLAEAQAGLQTLTDNQPDVAGPVDALRQEMAQELNALKATRSGNVVPGDPKVKIEKKEGAEEKVDLLAGVGQAQVRQFTGMK